MTRQGLRAQGGREQEVPTQRTVSTAGAQPEPRPHGPGEPVQALRALLTRRGSGLTCPVLVIMGKRTFMVFFFF